MQTSVEWLFEEIKHIIPDTFLNKFEKAKEMEKQQIECSFADGFVEGVQTQKYGEQLLFPKQYYTETFKNK